MSSDEGKPQSSIEQDLIRELTAILTESDDKDAKPTGKIVAKSHESSSIEPGAVNHDLIRDLAGLLAENNLTEIEIEHKGTKVRVSRGGTPMVGVAVGNPAMPVSTTMATAAGAPSSAPAAETHLGAVTSPMVGTAYLSPEPGAAAFVQVGDSVREGQTLMIVEAMKTMNPIPAPKAGRVSRILVDDGQPVEYGEALILIE